MPIIELKREDEKPAPQIVELDLEGGAGVRALASIPANPETKVNYLRAVYGADNVKVVQHSPLFEGTGEPSIFIRDPNVSDKFFPFDSSKVTVSDFTSDLVGGAIATLPTLFVGTSTRNVAAAGAAGEAVRQGVAAFLPGQDTTTLGERVKDVAFGAGAAAVGQGIANTGARVFDALRPKNFVARRVRKAEATPFAEEGRKLSEETGIPLTLAEETGSRDLAMGEALARRDIVTADEFFDFQQQQLTATTTRLRSTLDKVGPERGLLELGESVTKAYDDAVSNAMELRRAQAAVDFAKVAEFSQGRAVIHSDNLQSEITHWLTELDVPGAGDATQKLLNQGRRLLSSIQDNGGAYTAEQVNRLLQLYTLAQRGTGVLLKDMDKSQSRLVAGRFKDALLRDLDMAADAGEGDVAKALKVARDNYRLNSSAITELANSTLARAIGNGTRAPEAIAEKFFRMHPSEVRSSMAILEKASPETAQAVRRNFVDAAMVSARDVAPTRTGAAGVRFSAAKFIKALPDDDVLTAAGFKPEELGEIKGVVKILERIADKSLQGSPTAPIGLSWDTLTGTFQAGASGAVTAGGLWLATGDLKTALAGAVTVGGLTMGRSVVRAFSARQIARSVLTPEGRQAIRTLSMTSPGTKKAEQALLTMAMLAGAPSLPGFTRPVPSKAEVQQEVEQLKADIPALAQ